MRAIPLLVGMAGLAIPALCQTSGPTADALMHTSTSFDLLVRAPYAQTATLFGPNGERVWAGEHWNPRFLHPQPAADVEGAVFTIPHGPIDAVWVNTLFNVDARHFQYVYFLPDFMVTVIDVRFNPLASGQTSVHVVYSRTAITPAGNEHVAAMTEGDRTAGREWQQSIDRYLSGTAQKSHQ